jgi:hypothetical protein
MLPSITDMLALNVFATYTMFVTGSMPTPMGANPTATVGGA